jgi:hypothetical protein
MPKKKPAPVDGLKSLDLRKPDDCRWYCNNFEIPGRGKLGFVELSGGRRVQFHDMSDEDAILIANQLYEMELEAETRVKKRVIDEGGLVH